MNVTAWMSKKDTEVTATTEGLDVKPKRKSSEEQVKEQACPGPGEETIAAGDPKKSTPQPRCHAMKGSRQSTVPKLSREPSRLPKEPWNHVIDTLQSVFVLRAEPQTPETPMKACSKLFCGRFPAGYPGCD